MCQRLDSFRSLHHGFRSEGTAPTPLFAVFAMVMAVAGFSVPVTSYAQVPTPADRVRAALAASSVSAGDQTSQVSATVDEESRVVLRAISAQRGVEVAERHLAAVLVRTPSSPRGPSLARGTTLALAMQPMASDATATPRLEVAMAEGSLAVGGTATHAESFLQVVPGAAADLLVSPRPRQISRRLVGALALVQDRLRVELSRSGELCSTAVAILPDEAFERVDLEVTSRCNDGVTNLWNLRLDNLRFDIRQRLTSARLQLLAGGLAAGDDGRVLFVPALLRGQLWDDASPGLVALSLGTPGAETSVDFTALGEGGTTPDCVADATTLCLDDQPNDGRFRVTLSWSTAAGGGLSGNAQATPLDQVGLPSGGLFSFFEGNPEFLVKILDGCAINGHWWLFGAPTTTLGFRLEVEDLVAKAAGRPSEEYLQEIENVDGVTAAAFSLLEAFPGCDL